jgi:autotransporter-associated beta strand protein
LYNCANVGTASVVFNNSAKNYTIQSVGAFGITSGSVSLNGTGAVTISNANTYSGGTSINAGTLNIKNASAIGSGPLTLNGGTFDNTSGGPLTLSNAENWNGTFTFTGSSNLTTGAVTLLGSSSVNVATGGSDLVVGPINGTGSVTKSGTGTLTVNSTAGASTITGDLNVNAGTVQIGLPGATTVSNFNVGGLTGSGTVENASGASGQTRTLTVSNSSNEVFSGILQDGAGATNAAAPAGGRLRLTKTGSGSLTLSGSSTLSDSINVNGGQLVLTGSIIPAVPNSVVGGGVVVSSAAAPDAVLTIAGGNLQATQSSTNAPSVQIGAGNGTAGALNVSGAATLNSPSELWLGTADGGYGVMNMSGGTVTIGSWFAFARGGGQGVLNLSGGSITVSGSPVTIGSFGGALDPGVVHGLANVTGGTLAVAPANAFYVGEGTAAVLNISGTGRVVGGNTGIRIALGNFYSPANGSMVNLLPGGRLVTSSVTAGAGSGTLNFNGGTLQATVPSFSLIGSGTLTTYIYGGGAIIDDGGNAVIADNAFLAPPGNGVSATGLSVSGTGFIGTPVVAITGGGGTGATANATIDANGNLTGITITNPGINYTSAPTFTILGGGLGSTSSITGTASIGANVSSGLTKIGSGNLTLSGANTYTGNTTVQQGTLTIGSTSALPINTRLALNGGKLAPSGQSLLGNGNALQLLSNSGIDMAGTPQLIFADSHLVPWTAGSTVSILNWTGNLNTGGGASELIFGIGGLTTGAGSQVSQIHFQGFNGATLLASGANAGEVVPTSVSTRILGDWNVSNGTPTAADLPAMLTALTDLNVWKTSHSLTNDDMLNIGDVNLDGKISNADIQAELDLLSSLGAGATAAVPEPSTCVLLVLGAIPGYLFVRRRRKEFGSDSD